MFGKIASFMEMGFTYNEVLDMPLRNLVMLQSDKIRVAYGKVVRELSEEEEKSFVERKLAGQKQ